MTQRAAVTTVLSLLDVRDPIFSRDTNWGDLVVTMVKEGEAGRKVADARANLSRNLRSGPPSPLRGLRETASPDSSFTSVRLAKSH
jgi:hypothetical protein